MKKSSIALTASFLLVILLQSCKKDEWKPGIPLPKEKIKIGVVYITDPLSETSGFAFSHKNGIEEMKKKAGLADSQIIHRVNIDDSDFQRTENVMRELIAQGVNLIISTAEFYTAVCEKLAEEYPNVIFSQFYANAYNGINLTNFYGHVYEARYLSGIVAGLQTESGRIGYVAAWGKENSQVSSGLNAFALGVEKVNPDAVVFVKVTHSWFDPMGEAAAARALIAEGCDIIAQHCDTSHPQIETGRAMEMGINVWGIGYNTDMIPDSPQTVLTSVIWKWEEYYTILVQSIINGSFSAEPWSGSIRDGIVDLSPLNRNIVWEIDTLLSLETERKLIESENFFVFEQIEPADAAASTDAEDEILSKDEIPHKMNWYHRNIREL